MAFFGITVNFIIQKLKSKHLVCLNFLWWQVFLREQEKMFYAYLHISADPTNPLKGLRNSLLPILSLYKGRLKYVQL